MKELTTEDIRNEFIRKYTNNEFRTINNNVQEDSTIEIQNAHFIVDKPWIIRKPNYDYFKRELEWYDSQSLNVNDIPDGAPSMWKKCATPLGYINSNYGWCIYSEENHEQFVNCINHLCEDPHTREACMIYTRPSIQNEYNTNGMHDFICTYSTQCFLNEVDNADNEYNLDYIVYMRSNDAVFGFCNDSLWHMTVMERMANVLQNEMNAKINIGKLYWNAGSLHVYKKHYKYLLNN